MIDLKDYLLKALEVAETRRGSCAPNPAVGAVIVKDGQIIATGTHWAAGHPHAEVDALHKAGKAAKGATLYATLEPCCHHGKTPPCTDAILAAGIERVVFGFADPNPVASKGCEVLTAAGIECKQFSLPEIDLFYHSYAHWLAHQRPWVRLKLAISADAKIAGESGKPVPISGAACNGLTQQYRYHSDAILTTVQTLLNDNPKMNARLPNKTVAKPLFVLDSHLRLDHSMQVFKTAKSIVVYHRDDIATNEALNCVPVPFNQQGLDLAVVLTDLGRRGVHDLWIEVGARAFDAFYRNQWVDEVIFYRSQKILGEQALPAFLTASPIEAHELEWEPLGEDEVARLTMKSINC